MSFLTRLRGPRGPEEDDKLPDFAGKFLVIYPAQERAAGGVFRDAKAVRVGFNVFVVGRRVGLEPRSQERWSRAVVWTSIHQIAQMLVFDDLESAEGEWTDMKFGLP